MKNLTPTITILLSILPIILLSSCADEGIVTGQINPDDIDGGIVAGYSDPCGPNHILIGDICIPRSEFSEEELRRLLQRTPEEVACESITAAGGELPDECLEEE